MFKTLFKALVLLLFSLPIVLVILAINVEPNAAGNPSLNDDQITQIQQLLIDHDPRLLVDSDDQIIQLSETELNALLGYFKSSVLNNLNSPFNVKQSQFDAELTTGELQFNISLAIPRTPFGSYINYSITMVEDQNSFKIDTFKLGQYTIPTRILQPLLTYSQNTLAKNNNYQFFNSLLASINQVTFQNEGLEIVLDWQQDNLATIQEQARLAFISDAEATRIKKYHQLLTEITHTFPATARTVSLNRFFNPLFAEAYANSENGANPIDENRAIFIVLTTYLTDLRVEQLTGSPRGDTLRKITVTLGPRSDLVRHLVVSAAIAASAGAGVADILSIYKEVNDSRYSSGFSFTDITANEVGTALGALASQTTLKAKQLQRLLMISSSETDYMPIVGGIDGLTEQEFIDIYDNRLSAAYLQRIEQIRTLISERPVFQLLTSR